ncbi:MAG: hypothetical protein K6F53_08510 [Lachnospiraceae bacterium]|nr:hypothetical protein [Lachnospiraceae bacterium]
MISDGNAIAYTDIALAVSAWNETAGATLKLLSNVSVSETIEVDNGSTDHPMILDLNDHGILMKGDNSVISVSVSSIFMLVDRSATQTDRFIRIEYGKGKEVYEVEPHEDGLIKVTGGYITGGLSATGGGILNSGTFIMSGGTIAGNRAYAQGGGIYTGLESQLMINGGVIVSNTAMEGKAVYNDGGNVRIGGEILAGSEIDGSDAGNVSPGKASDDAGTYGFLSAASFTYDPIVAQTYTGKAIVPDIKVYYCGTLLRKNKDYKIKFSNNTNADDKASFTITGKGNTSG